jgi:pimeloyl-ACP methyl ester carboxylesterase
MCGFSSQFARASRYMLLSLGVAIIFSTSLRLCAQAHDTTATQVVPERAVEDPKPVEAEYRKLDQTLTVLRERNAKQFAIDSAKGIDEARYVAIGGIEQWVTIRGEDRNNPVLLFLHGGPGDVTNPWTFALFAPWERQFTVVQWDQRGAGRTLRKTGPSVAPTVTVERISQDGIELSEYLRKYLGKRKIILVAHSFGSIVGLRMVRSRPDLFYAYVGTGQVADETRNYAVAYVALLKKARALGNQRAVDELSRVGPPPYPSGEGYGVQRKWANSFEGADRFLPGTLGLTLVGPGYSVQDLNDAIDGQILSGERLVPEARSGRPRDLGVNFAIRCSFSRGLKTSRLQPRSPDNTSNQSGRRVRSLYRLVEGTSPFS